MAGPQEYPAVLSVCALVVHFIHNHCQKQPSMVRKGVPVYATTTLSPHTPLPTGEGTWACRGDSGTC